MHGHETCERLRLRIILLPSSQRWECRRAEVNLR